MPWKSIGSQPVDVLIENVHIVVSKILNFIYLLSLEPITDQSAWEHTDSSELFELKEAALNAFANQIYQDLIVRSFFLVYLFLRRKRKKKLRKRLA